MWVGVVKIMMMENTNLSMESVWREQLSDGHLVLRQSSCLVWADYVAATWERITHVLGCKHLSGRRFFWEATAYIFCGPTSFMNYHRHYYCHTLTFSLSTTDTSLTDRQASDFSKQKKREFSKWDFVSQNLKNTQQTLLQVNLSFTAW